MPSLTIRRYQPGDREACRTLWKELVEWHREIYLDATIGGEQPEDHFDRHLAETGPERLWVAVHDSQVIGLAGLILRGNEAEIEPLIVSKACRNQGIGTQLVRAVVEEARSLGMRSLSVKLVARNAKAIAFLHKQGFKNLGHIELFLDFSNHKWEQGPKLFGLRFDF